MDDLFQAVDITALSTGVSTIMIALVGVGLLFLGFKYVRRVISK